MISTKCHWTLWLLVKSKVSLKAKLFFLTYNFTIHQSFIQQNKFKFLTRNTVKPSSASYPVEKMYISILHHSEDMKNVFLQNNLNTCWMKRKLVRQTVLEERLWRGMSHLNHLPLPCQTLQFVHTKGWGVLQIDLSSSFCSCFRSKWLLTPKARERLKEADRPACCPVPPYAVWQ